VSKIGKTIREISDLRRFQIMIERRKRTVNALSRPEAEQKGHAPSSIPPHSPPADAKGR
jgi:hypothetical protein